METLRETISELEERMNQLKNKLDLQTMRQELKKLEVQSMKQDFWQDETKAKDVMQDIAEIQDSLSLVDEIDSGLEETKKIIDLAEQETGNQDQLKKQLQTEINAIKRKIENFEIQTFLGGSYDKLPAILSIHAGQGGTEAMDWTAMLFRMYTKFFENQSWKWKLIEETHGEEAGLKSATLMVNHRFAYGYLKGEAGVHRLVRQSPFNADNLRQTSFALVEVLPQIDKPEKIDIRPEDINFQAFRSSGHGGQNVNKVSTAVRLKHLPSGIVVESQAQRHQEQNRKIALQLLTAKLWDKEQKEHQKKVQSIKGEHVIAGWGNQIRSYVLHPYHMVKDLRTDVETQDTQAVLDGELKPFIDAEIRQL